MSFVARLDRLQPSQLYISSDKLAGVMEWFDREPLPHLESLPVTALADRTVLTDGHTRALAAHLRGLSAIAVVWDEGDLDRDAYEVCVTWCRDDGVHSIADLASRVVAPDEYERLWHERCRRLHEDLAAARGDGSNEDGP